MAHSGIRGYTNLGIRTLIRILIRIFAIYEQDLSIEHLMLEVYRLLDNAPEILNVFGFGCRAVPRLSYLIPNELKNWRNLYEVDRPLICPEPKYKYRLHNHDEIAYKYLWVRRIILNMNFFREIEMHFVHLILAS